MSGQKAKRTNTPVKKRLVRETKSKNTRLFESLTKGMSQVEKGRYYQKAMRLAKRQQVDFPIALESVISGKPIRSITTNEVEKTQKQRKPSEYHTSPKYAKKRKHAARNAAKTRMKNLTKGQRKQIARNRKARSIQVVSGGKFSPR